MAYRIRKNLRSLSADEKSRFVAALLKLKKEGRYDQYVHWHHAVMKPAVYPWEPGDAVYRNGAHRGPNFLPWHREFLLQVERDLQAIDERITIPFWDWTEDAALTDPAQSPVWDENMMGGNGDPNDGWRVASGPFAFNSGNWPIPMAMDGPALTRRFGSFPNVGNLPTTQDLNMALNETFYDTPPFNSGPFCLGFRNRLEGWITQRGDPNVKTKGSQLHNRVHLWVGGRWKDADSKDVDGSMVRMTSPNDPVFFLHHCFVDKVWADWQERQRANNAEAEPHYAPIAGGPPGHNLEDRLAPWTRTIREVLDIRSFGYTYEQPPPGGGGHVHHLGVAAPRESPFFTRSPFEAD